MFGILDTAGSALRTNRVWMDAVSDNLANINTIRPFDQPAFQSRSIIATAVRGDVAEAAGTHELTNRIDGHRYRPLMLSAWRYASRARSTTARLSW